MPVYIPLILVALGSLSLLVLRDPRAVLVGLGVQWFGLIISFMPADVVTGDAWFGAVGVEAITAVVCLVVLYITLRNLQAFQLSRLPGLSDDRRRALQRAESAARYAPPAFSREGFSDNAWLLAVALVAGITGYGLARLYPLGASEGGMLAFYWVILLAAMTLVVHGTRDAIKMTAALLALLNATALAIQLFSLTPPGGPALGLMAAGRIGLCVALAYCWVLLKIDLLSPNLDLAPLFDGRDGRWATDTALTVVAQPPVAEEPVAEAVPTLDAQEEAAPGG